MTRIGNRGSGRRAPRRRLLALAAAFLCATLATCATPPPPPEEERAEMEILRRFVRLADGTYGYDPDSTVPYHRFTSEPVMLPAAPPPLKRQFRAAWVATVHNLDMPQAQSREHFQSEFAAILDVMADWNMNALIFQIRPALDAFFPSRLNPWSQFLTGRQGEDPGWDPLEWMVAQTHARGMEFHAWFNPYRVTASNYRWLHAPPYSPAQLIEMETADLVRALNRAGLLADGNFAVRHPQYVYRFNGRLYLDPGVPAVRAHVVESVREVIERYDVCAVHFDDYFYPYRAGALLFGAAGEDRATFERYGLGAFPDTPAGIQAWRRENNTELVRAVAAAITAENERSGRAIQFGISPFGIWEHAQNDPRGSNTPTGSAQTFSTQVFADSRMWAREGLVDYVIPQIYWSFDQGAAPYAELVRWWASVADGANVSLRIGHANYKHIDNAPFEPAWMNPEEILNQMRYNRLHPQVDGSAFFRFGRLLPVPETEPRHRAANAANELLRASLREYMTIIPAMPWLQPTPPPPPANLARRGTELTWDSAEGSNARYYVVFRFQRSRIRREGLENLVSDPRNIVARVWRSGDSRAFADPAPPARPRRYAYVVMAFNAAHVESAPALAR